MIEVSQREFQIKYYEYSKGFDAIRVVKKGGEVVGVFYPSAVHERLFMDKGKDERSASKSKSSAEGAVRRGNYGIKGVQRGYMKVERGVVRPIETNESAEGYELKEEPPDEYFEEKEKCEICKGVENVYRFWEEGEERQCCEVCLRRKLGKLANGVIRQAVKLNN